MDKLLNAARYQMAVHMSDYMSNNEFNDSILYLFIFAIRELITLPDIVKNYELNRWHVADIIAKDGVDECEIRDCCINYKMTAHLFDVAGIFDNLWFHDSRNEIGYGGKRYFYDMYQYVAGKIGFNAFGSKGWTQIGLYKYVLEYLKVSDVCGICEDLCYVVEKHEVCEKVLKMHDAISCINYNIPFDECDDTYVAATVAIITKAIRPCLYISLDGRKVVSDEYYDAIDLSKDSNEKDS